MRERSVTTTNVTKFNGSQQLGLELTFSAGFDPALGFEEGASKSSQSRFSEVAVHCPLGLVVVGSIPFALITLAALGDPR